MPSWIATYFSALKLAETPDTKVQFLFKIKRSLRIPDESIFGPQSWANVFPFRRMLLLLVRRFWQQQCGLLDKDRESFVLHSLGKSPAGFGQQLEMNGQARKIARANLVGSFSQVIGTSASRQILMRSRVAI